MCCGLELIEEELPEDAPEDPLEAVELTRAVGQVQQLVKRVTQQARLTPAPRQPIALQQVVDGAAALCRHRFHDVELRCQLSEGLTVSSNASELTQVLVNLLDNAGRRWRPRSAVWVRGGSQRGRVVLRVSDPGPRPPSVVMDWMFRAAFTTRAAGEGTGQGLQICKRIVTDHGGSIGVDREAPETTFVVELPSNAASA